MFLAMRSAPAAPFLLAPLLCSGPLAQEALRPEAFLPPALPWDGASRGLVVAPDDPWITPCERSGLTRSPSYRETVAFTRRLADASPLLSLVSLGRSAEQREVWMVIAARAEGFTPEALRRSGKPILLAQAGIHSGEIDGKDAGLMLLRDIVTGKKDDLLDGASFLFVPIFSVDGHERSSKYGRINQRGPVEMGWRTNARNLNLNRDYAKADTPEMRCMLRALNTWEPDLYVDLHVTDGADYQYDITFGFSGPSGWSPNGATWMGDVLTPAVNADLEALGHIPGPLVFAVDGSDLSRGIVDFQASPRYSNGYGDARQLPTVLVENHSLKPYDQRVLGTYVLLESMLRTVAAHSEGLKTAIAKDRALRPDPVPVAFGPREAPLSIEFKGIEPVKVFSKAAGVEIDTFGGEPFERTIPYVKLDHPTETVPRAKAYWIPAAWPEVIELLAIHGIQGERIASPRTLEVECYRLEDPELRDSAFEGAVRIASKTAPETHTLVMAPGSFRVPTDQPLGTLATLLLEPAHEDSLFQWGFFHEILQRTEYFETYAMAPLADRMMAENAELEAEFEARLAKDEAFAANPRARLHWWYERSPYHDERHLLYPVVREVP